MIDSADRSVRLSKVGRDFNLGLHTIASFLTTKGYEIEPNPNTPINETMYRLVAAEFGTSTIEVRMKPAGILNDFAPRVLSRFGKADHPIPETHGASQDSPITQPKNWLPSDHARFQPKAEVALAIPSSREPGKTIPADSPTQSSTPQLSRTLTSTGGDPTVIAEKIELTPEFEKALDWMENTSKNLFITGNAGTGKSTLLRLHRERTKKKTVVIAPTGIAALQVDGKTAHSLFRFPLHLVLKEHLKLDQERVQLFSALETLIIDEVSMLRSDLFCAIDYALRMSRGSIRGMLPFGGVQLIVFGDVFQLPPVVINDENRILKDHFGGGFFFHPKIFAESAFETIELKKIFRQKDPEFISMLNEVRCAEVSTATLGKLNERVRLGPPDGTAQLGNEAIVLMGTNALAETHNSAELAELPGMVHRFDATIVGRFEKGKYPAPIELYLKEGAQVMFTKNGNGYVNGSIGTVSSIVVSEVVQIDVMLDGKLMRIQKASWGDYDYSYDPRTGKVKIDVCGTFHQYPLKLAWAITIHKSQGLSFDRVHLDLGNGAFAHGQTYVALSRCRTLEGLTLNQPITERDLIIDKDVLTFFESGFNPLEHSLARDFAEEEPTSSEEPIPNTATRQSDNLDDLP